MMTKSDTARQTASYGIGRCALGLTALAVSGRGIIAILLGDDPDALASGLQARFPAIALIRDDAACAVSLAGLAAFVASPQGGWEPPLDPRGTPFQRRVWRALQDIPPGATATYTDIAARIGAPGAARAVSGACAANHLAVAIPCHRIIRRDGALSGYRWGAARKRELLAREARA